MKWKLNSKDYRTLHNTIAEAIGSAYSDPEKSEPQLIANLVWHLPQCLNKVSLSRGYSIKSSGVFVHARPLVTCTSFPKKGSVEIGDLLLLRTAARDGIVYERRAMLLQAKKVKTIPVSPDNKNQHHLYANWPKFEYKLPAILKGEKRHIRGHDLYNASKYFVILKDFPEFCSYKELYCYRYPCCIHGYSLMTAQPTYPTLSHYNCFCCDILNFILGDAGKEYTFPPPARTNNWDMVIYDLIRGTENLISKYSERASGGSSASRRNMFFYSGVFPKYSRIFETGISMTKLTNGSDGPPIVRKEWTLDNGEDGGIPTIEFTINFDGSGVQR
ncbi:hypothetical protein [Desulfolutivibrio sulfoxidireducens]|uniref:hypothetical protein n=1 Tax=Desulfolutivibrio sulfoxidireducens TaxID=2773299 RepID=UPI00210E9012|nr:hypothetical protein [Desulfolutivibrio sulfoxidireducens]